MNQLGCCSHVCALLIIFKDISGITSKDLGRSLKVIIVGSKGVLSHVGPKCIHFNNVMVWSGQDGQWSQSKRETTAGVQQSGFILQQTIFQHTQNEVDMVLNVHRNHKAY